MELWEEAGRAALQVCDDGAGISPEHPPHRFDHCYRGDDARTGIGSGLGSSPAAGSPRRAAARGPWRASRGTPITCDLPTTSSANVRPVNQSAADTPKAPGTELAGGLRAFMFFMGRAPLSSGGTPDGCATRRPVCFLTLHEPAAGSAALK